jgi:polyhydroxybutyrate depolymerase
VSRVMIAVVAASGLLLSQAVVKVASAAIDEQRRGGERPEEQRRRSGERRGEQRGGAERLELQHGGLKRTALLYVPSQYDGKSAIPLVLSFHGRHGEGKDQAELSDLHAVGERHGFIVVYPDGIAKSWNALHGSSGAEKQGVDDVKFVDALIDKLSERFRIDPDRVYASGMSNGAFFTHRLGCERSDRFAAIAAVSGAMAPALAERCKPHDPVAVVMFNGTNDRFAPYSGGSTRGGGAALSAEKTAEVWSRWNRCTGPMKETFRKGDVIGRSFEGCGAPVTLYTIEGAGHTWPGGHQYMARLLVGSTNRDITASEMMWAFFQENPKRRTSTR